MSANIPQQVKTDQWKAILENEIKNLEYTIWELSKQRAYMHKHREDTFSLDRHIDSLMRDMKELTDKLLYK